MAKIKIAQNPTFEGKVQIPRVGRASEEVKFTFKYLDRMALAELFDKWREAREALAEAAKGEGYSFAKFTEAEVALQVEQIQDIVAGWGFDDEFTEDSIRALAKTCVGAPKAVVDAYQEAYVPARLGN